VPSTSNNNNVRNAVDARKFDNNGNNANYVAMANRFSIGRRQPYSAFRTQWVQQAPQGAPNTAAQTTFFRHNGIEPTAANQLNPPQTLGRVPQGMNRHEFDVLFHADRQLVSPAELLHMSGFAPHLLTQQFVQPVNGVTQAHQHAASTAFLDQRSRLYRF